MGVSVLVADDQPLWLTGLRAVLTEAPDLEVVGTASTGREAVDLAAACHPDVIVMDLHLPELNGLEATRQVAAFGLPSRVILMAAAAERRMVVDALRAGAAGFLLKNCECDALVTGVRTVSAGRRALAPEVMDIVVQELDAVQNGQVGAGGMHAGKVLSPREREVLQLVAEGLPTKQIAAHLDITVKTVETHRRHIMSKLGLYSIAELTKYAIREGLTALED